MEKALKDKLRSELLWTSTKQGAFQRSRIYEKPEKIKLNKNDESKEKKKLRIFLEKFLYEEIYIGCKNRKIEEDELYKIINRLINKVNKKFRKILRDNKMRFGNAQKFVNLYLKLMWIAGWGKEPPHFPVDRIIQRNLPGIYPWTDMNKETYRKIITNANNVRKNNSVKTLAMWETLEYLELSK